MEQLVEVEQSTEVEESVEVEQSVEVGDLVVLYLDLTTLQYSGLHLR